MSALNAIYSQLTPQQANGGASGTFGLPSGYGGSSISPVSQLGQLPYGSLGSYGGSGAGAGLLPYAAASLLAGHAQPSEYQRQAAAAAHLLSAASSLKSTDDLYRRVQGIL